jgi:hypothetical protein
MMMTTVAAGALLGCSSLPADVSITNRSSRALQVAVGQSSRTIAPGQTSTLAMSEDRLISFKDAQTECLVSEPSDLPKSEKLEIVWAGDCRLGFKV